MVAANANFRLEYIETLPNLSGDRAMTLYRQSLSQPPVSADDIRIHAWINERIVAVDRERHGLRSKVRRFLSW